MDDHGLDVRTTVLRVATDLFCQNTAHSPADIARYTDLALALLKSADAATRRTIAEKLAKHPNAPARVLAALLDDPDIGVSTPVLEHSTALERENMAAFIATCGTAEAAALARRADLDFPAVRLLAVHRNDIVVEALLENRRIAFDPVTISLLAKRVEGLPDLTRLLLDHPGIDPADLASFYPHAPAEKRSAIRQAVRNRHMAQSPAVPVSALTALNEAVQAQDRIEIGKALAKALHLDAAHMNRILDDPSGELFALALLAAGIKRAPAVNVLLIAAATSVRTSVERINAMAALIDATPRHVARRIVAAVVGEHRARPLFEPHMHDSTTPQRSVQPRRRPLRPALPVRRTETSGKS